MTSTDVAVPTTDTLAPLSRASREAAVTTYLTIARDQLAHALEASGAEAVAAVKAEIATAADATKHLGLSKEIQADALEMVRRAEYTLGKAIRKGQEAGEIAKRSDNLTPGGGPRRQEDTRSSLPSSKEFFSNGDERTETYVMADGATDEEFADVLTEAREEGNLSRANVVRKVKGQDSKRTRAQLANDIEALAV
jgi:hypothetical protein